MKQIINSILDTDLYKLTMQNFVIQHYPEVEVEYIFSNRNKSMKFTEEFHDEFHRQKWLMSKLRLTDAEYDWMKENLTFLPASYRQYLSAYRFDPTQVHSHVDDSGDLNIRIKGKWRDTILWEVPLMAIISELYFSMIDTDWTMEGQEKNIDYKGRDLVQNKCKFTDFGTRRRRSYNTQDLVVKGLSKYRNMGFIGTSNPHFAMKYHLTPIGTCAHEAISAVAALDSLNHPNKLFMEKWAQTYGGRLGIMLPDTFGLDSFFNDFSIEKGKLWDGLRHDSGDPFVFTDKVMGRYKSMNINPQSKLIVYSNSLTTDEAIRIKEYCGDFVDCSFGIGTHFTNDFLVASDPSKDSKPLNMVIKLYEAGGVKTVKLSDDEGKEIGDPKMVEIMKYIHKNK